MARLSWSHFSMTLCIKIYIFYRPCVCDSLEVASNKIQQEVSQFIAALSALCTDWNLYSRSKMTRISAAPEAAAAGGWVVGSRCAGPSPASSCPSWRPPSWSPTGPSAWATTTTRHARHGESSCRAGHFRYFWIFSIIKNDFFHFYSC